MKCTSKIYLRWYSSLAIRYSEAKPWHNALLRHSGNLNNDNSTTTEPENKRTRCMVSDDVVDSVEIVAYCESYFFNMELPLYRKKCLQWHIKSMFTKHEKAERKMIFIICNVLNFVLNKKNDKG